jgi:hypothetical protein
MRLIIGFLSGVLGMLAGWAGLAALVVSLAGPDRDGGIAMGAVFQIGPIGGIVGFIAGVFLFAKFGMVSQDKSPTHIELPEAAATPMRKRVSPVFAVPVLLIVGGLAWWGWYELIRSPYLSHGFMTLELQFRLPAGMALPPSAEDVHITVNEGPQPTDVLIGQSWHGTDGDHRVILARASLSMKTSQRIVSLELPGVPEQTWQLNLSSDADPTQGYTEWQFANGAPTPKIEMNFQLTADH